MNNAKDSTQPERSICGAKFRDMLKCVETTGASAACTERINDFLACERLVFRTALAKQPPNPPAPDRSRVQAQPQPRSTPKPGGDANGVPSHGAMFSRVVDKQLSACSSLADSVRRPEFRTGFTSFSKRMIADIRVTFDTVRIKLGKVFNELRDRIARNGD